MAPQILSWPLKAHRYSSAERDSARALYALEEPRRLYGIQDGQGCPNEIFGIYRRLETEISRGDLS
jgi:hypothetical protein